MTYLKQKITIEVSGMPFYGTVMGKLKNADAYIVFFDIMWLTHLMELFGTPIRHIELEWGSFVGCEREFIIPTNMIKAV